MPITLNGTTGVVTPGATVGSITGILKATSGVVSQAVIGTDYSDLTLDTAKSASGTAVNFTGIPSWVKRITVMFNGVSTNGTSQIQIQLGNGSIVTTGYNSSSWTSNTINNTSTAGFLITGVNANAAVYYGNAFICLQTGNTWVESHSMGGVSTYNCIGGGSIALGGTLDRVSITTVNGTDTFDAGTINISYE